MPIRFDITFTGRVQGVNFRWTTFQIAKRHAIAGWVRNEPDGSVRCVVEGDADEIEEFVNAVGGAMDAYITDTEIRRLEASGELEGFGIR